jgi:hypothetical protein
VGVAVAVIASSFHRSCHSEESGSDDGECENEVFMMLLIVGLVETEEAELSCSKRGIDRRMNLIEKTIFFSITHQNP